MKRLVIAATLLFCFMVIAFMHVEQIEDVVQYSPVVAQETVAMVSHATRPTTLLFVGDIMLGRDVETRMDAHGSAFPFAYMETLLTSPDITIGNFEGVVSPIHEHTPSMTFHFSIKEEYLKQLKVSGFDILSLANNHSLNYGTSSLAYTHALCMVYELACYGSPVNTSEYITYTRFINGKKIGFIFIHTLYNEPDREGLATALTSLSQDTDFQIAYVHWGNEYELVHSVPEQKLAEQLIDFGIDVVVGHHPHVVQDIGIYKNKLIVYSLGNFIFDQYFSDDVQEALALRVNIDTNHVSYEFIPLTTKYSRIQPQELSGERAYLMDARIFPTLNKHNGFNAETRVLTLQAEE